MVTIKLFSFQLKDEEFWAKLDDDDDDDDDDDNVVTMMMMMMMIMMMMMMKIGRAHV